MSGVSRLPGNYVTITNNHPGLPDNIEKELKNFHEMYLTGSDEVSIGYTHDAILVRTNNSMVWSKKVHEVFAHQFNLILSSFDRIEHYEPRGYSLELDFLYTQRFKNEEYNKMYSIDINKILRF